MAFQSGEFRFDSRLQPLGVPCSANSKESASNTGDPGSIPGSGRSPGRRKLQPTPVFLPGEPSGQRSLAGYTPWGRKGQIRLRDKTTIKELIKSTPLPLLIFLSILAPY